jgi:hypothetical protein
MTPPPTARDLAEEAHVVELCGDPGDQGAHCPGPPGAFIRLSSLYSERSPQ